MSARYSGQQLAEINLTKFNDWIAERDKAGDWVGYTRGGKLSRSEIAAECGFALSVLRQNPAVKSALEALENCLRAAGILQAKKNDPGTSETFQVGSDKAVDRRIMIAKSQSDARVKALEEQNATLKAEIRELRNSLKRFQHIDDYLARTGRLLPI